MNDERRSRTDGMTGARTQGQDHGQGVGGRHRERPPAPGGGGYLDVYIKTGAADPRLLELAEMNLSSKWIQIAAAIGVDAFLVVWRILDDSQSNSAQTGYATRLRVPLFSQYMKYQRNKVIHALSGAGMSSNEIKEKIKKDLCEDLHRVHIAKIARKNKNKDKKRRDSDD